MTREQERELIDWVGRFVVAAERIASAFERAYPVWTFPVVPSPQPYPGSVWTNPPVPLAPTSILNNESLSQADGQG